MLEDKIMRLNQAARKIGGAALAIAMLLGIGAAFSSTAQAQSWGWRPYYRGDGDYDYDDNYGRFGRGTVIQIAERFGFRDGFSIGRQDRFSGRRPDFDDSFRFRNAMAGYRPAFGDPELYRQAYRHAFRRGYEQGFRSVGFYRW